MVEEENNRDVLVEKKKGNVVAVVVVKEENNKNLGAVVAHFVAMFRVVSNNRGSLQLLAYCPAYQRQLLLKRATPQWLHALVEVLYNLLMGHIFILEENK